MIRRGEPPANGRVARLVRERRVANKRLYSAHPFPRGPMLVDSPYPSVARVIAALFCAFSIGCSDESPIGPRPANPPKRDVLPTPVLTVMNTNDAGPGSLRQTIFDAPARAIIQFDAAIAGKAIVLTTGPIKVAEPLVIEGPVPAGMTISGGLHSRVLDIFGAGDVILRNLSIVDGRDSEGGGIE